MTLINKVTIVGNLGTDSKTCYIPSGDVITGIHVTTTGRYRDKASGEMKGTTEWYRIAFFGRLVEVAGECLKKGSQVYIRGRLETRQWGKDGQKQYSTEVVADQLQILSKTPGDRGTAGANNFKSEDETPL